MFFPTIRSKLRKNLGGLKDHHDRFRQPEKAGRQQHQVWLKSVIRGQLRSKNLFLLELPVGKASPIYGFTDPMVAELESSIFKNLGNSHTTRTAIIASNKSISMEVSLLCFPIKLSFTSFCRLTQPQIMNGFKTLIFRTTTGLSVNFKLCHK